MAEISSPFGGITRIRFKGFDRHFSPIISARRLPRSIEIKSRASEVNPPRTRSHGTITEESSDAGCEICGRCHGGGSGGGVACGACDEVFAGAGDDE